MFEASCLGTKYKNTADRSRGVKTKAKIDIKVKLLLKTITVVKISREKTKPPKQLIDKTEPAPPSQHLNHKQPQPRPNIILLLTKAPHLLTAAKILPTPNPNQQAFRIPNRPKAINQTKRLTNKE